MTEDDGWVESTEGELDWDLTEEAGYAGWDPPPHRKLGPAVRQVALWLMLIAILGSVLVVLLQTGRSRLQPDPTPTPVFFTSSAPASVAAPADEGAQPEPVLFFARPAPPARSDA
jgi:hypothetical protein